jgi:hypothetical protein
MNRSLSFRLLPFLQGTAHKRGLIFGVIILCALLAFEVFNYSSTSFALRDILGPAGIRWATRWPAFCAIGLRHRASSPRAGTDSLARSHYLFGA